MHNNGGSWIGYWGEEVKQKKEKERKNKTNKEGRYVEKKTNKK